MLILKKNEWPNPNLLERQNYLLHQRLELNWALFELSGKYIFVELVSLLFTYQKSYTNTYYFTDGYLEQPDEHKLQTLSHVAAAVKSEFADLTKKLEAELEKYAVKEKEGWVKLDKLEEECKNLTKQVEKSTENLVRQLIDFATLGHYKYFTSTTL